MLEDENALKKRTSSGRAQTASTTNARVATAVTAAGYLNVPRMMPRRNDASCMAGQARKLSLSVRAVATTLTDKLNYLASRATHDASFEIHGASIGAVNGGQNTFLPS